MVDGWNRRRGIRLGALAVAFVVVHVALSALNVLDTAHNPAGDVTGVYRFWVDYWHSTGLLVGVDTDWVYPIGALPPMLLAGLLGDGPYLVAWLGLVTLLDAGATVLLVRRRESLAWWWLAFTALLGPVALSRLDGVALPVAIAGVLLVERTPWAASAVLTLAAWIKVWPAALVAALLVTGRRLAGVVAAAALTTAVIIGIALAVGARGTIFSFVGAQATRGLQVEAPVALPWLWSSAFGDRSVQIYYDTSILTFQLRGTGVAQAASIMTPVLALGVLAVVGLAVAARLRGADPVVLLAVAGLGLVAAAIALNKVGSPQYLTWYVAPILLGLLSDRRRFLPIAAAGLVAAGLTQLIYPWHYDGVTGAAPLALTVLTVRNLLQVALLGWCLVELARLPPAGPAPVVPSARPRALSAGR